MPLSKKIAFAAATTLALLALLELALAAAGLPRADSTDAPLEFLNADFGSGFPIERDDFLFWRLKPGAAIPGGTEKIDAQGFRGPDLSRAPNLASGAVRRALFLGDSNTFGIGVPEERTFVRTIGGRLGSGWEAVNAGVPGYSAFQMAQLLRRRGDELAPSAIVVYAGAWNDYMPAIGADDETSAAIQRRRSAETTGLGVARLRIYRTLRSWLSRPAPRADRDALARKFFTTRERPDGPRVSKEAFRRALTAISEIGHGRGAMVVFVTPPLPAKTRKAQPESEEYAAIVREVALAQGDRLADARHALAFDVEKDPAYFVDGVHPNADGHAVIAETIAAQLLR